MPLVYILFKEPQFANYPWFPPFVVIGTLAFLCGIWMIYRAHKDLGRSFSYTLEIRDQHELVDNGIYRYIRHPMYAAFLVWTIAQAMLLPNWIVGLCAPLVLGTLLAIRIPREEADDAANVRRRLPRLHEADGAVHSGCVLSSRRKFCLILRSPAKPGVSKDGRGKNARRFIGRGSRRPAAPGSSP